MVGPFGDTGRFTWWLRRIPRRAEVLGSVPVCGLIQLIDAATSSQTIGAPNLVAFHAHWMLQTPSASGWVILIHLHPHHAGGLASFPEAEVVVARRE